VTAQTLFAPAKLNLFLAITGRRADGFHDLVSVVTPISLGDTLSYAAAPAGEFRLTCNDPAVPCDDSNLVLKAARAFVDATHWDGGATFHLEKRVPMGAGLGGGSSDGVAALKALNALAGGRLDSTAMAQVAAQLGSDCPLFLQQQPLVMRGRGERVDSLPVAAANRLRGQRVLVFKPEFGIPTAWSYRRLAEMAAEPAASVKRADAEPVYLPIDAAEQKLKAWMDDPDAGPEALLFNTLERPAFGKYVALPTLLDALASRFAIRPRMTGSGSACFAFLTDRTPVEAISATIRQAWGESAFVQEARIA
jgi:4-diphosphocytidyl-2-C-methyl-D-erythritol kinase